MKAQKALKRLNKFLLGNYFRKCDELFYAELKNLDEKQEEALE